MTGPAFNGLAEGARFKVDGINFTISYEGGNGNEVELTVDEPVRYYVDINSTALSDGLSWNNAFTQLQDALALALEGDEIWVYCISDIGLGGVSAGRA